MYHSPIITWYIYFKPCENYIDININIDSVKDEKPHRQKIDNEE